MALESQGEEKGDNPMTGAVFTNSQPISNGFVFVEGQYVDAPYVISRKDLAIYINDKFIVTYAPLVKELPLPEKDRPVCPSNISTNAGPNDQVVTKYLYRMQNYLVAKQGRAEVADEMENILKTLPCIKDVKRDRGNNECAIITYMNGKTENMGLVPPSRKPVITPTNAVEYVSRTCRNYVERLKKGDFYRFAGNGSSIFTFSAQTAKDELPGLVKVLRSSQDDETKAKQLREMLRLPPISEEESKVFVANLCPSKQLDERVEALIKGDKSDK